MSSLGEAFIEVHADTDKLAPEIEAGARKAAKEVEEGDSLEGIVKAADKAGTRAGDNFGKSFIRDANGRLRDDKGRFVQEFDKIGKEAGEKLANSVGDSSEKTLRSRISGLGRLLAPAWIKTVAAWIAAIAPAAVQLVATLAPAVGILTAIVPAAIDGAAALGILKVAFGGLGDLVKLSTTDMAAFNKQLAMLGPSTQQFVKTLVALQPVFKQFKKDLQDSFFSGFNENATFGLFSKALDNLKFSLNAVATTLGTQLGGALNTVLSDKNLGRLNSIFLAFDDTLVNLGPLLGNLFSALLRIGTVAAPLLDRLFTSLTKSSGTFAKFIDRISNSGQFNDFLEKASQAFSQLLDLATDLSSIIFSIFSAAGKAGGGGAILTFVHQLALAFAELNKNGTLTEIFKAFNEFGDSIGKIIAPLLPVIGKLASVLGGSFLKIIEALTPPLVAISQSIADALIPVLPELGNALDALAPVLAQIGTVLADVFKQVTPDLAMVLVDLFVDLAKTFADLAPTLAIVLPALGELAVVLIKLLTAQTISLLQAFVVLLPGLAGALLILVAPLLAATKVLQGFVYVLDHFITPFFQNFPANASQSVDKIGKIFGKIGDFFSDIGKDIADFFTVTIPKYWDKFVTWLENLPEKLVSLIRRSLEKARDTILGMIGIIIGLIIATFTKLPGLIVKAISGLGEKIATFMSNEWRKALLTAAAFIDELKHRISMIPGQLADGLSSLGSKIGAVFTNAWDTAVKKTSTAIANIISYVRGLPARLAAFGGKLLATGTNLITGFLNGLAHPGKIINNISDTIFGFLKGKLNYVIDKLNEGINSVGKYVGGLPNIPRLARGAFVTHPTLALIGEQAPEVVVPTNDPVRAKQLLDESGLTQSLDFHSSTPNVGVQVFIGQKELTDIVDTQVTVANTRTSRQLAYGARTV